MRENEGVALEYTRNRVRIYADSLAAMSQCCRREKDVKEASPDEETIGEEYRREQLIEEAQRREERKLLGDYLEDISEHMQELTGQAFFISRYSGKEERRIKTFLLRERVLVREIMIFKRGEEDFVGMKVACKRLSGLEKSELAHMLSTLLKKEMVAADYTENVIRVETVTQIFWEKPRYCYTYGIAKAVKRGEKISGDNFSVVEKDNGLTIAMLSDGMGCGEEAYEDSSEVLDYVEKLLDMGFSPSEAMLNCRRLFLLKEENKSTLDMCVLNLHKGSGYFYKVGGVSSFLKSGKYVETISLPGLPLGIWTSRKNSFQEYIGRERELVNGDYVVMVTDGVIDALEKEDYEAGIRDYLAEQRDCHPKEMADRLLQFALEGCHREAKDDMTVLVFRIWDTHGI